MQVLQSHVCPRSSPTESCKDHELSHAGQESPPSTSVGTTVGKLKHRTSLSSTDRNTAWKSKIEHPALPKPLSWEGRGTAREKRQKIELFGGCCVDGNGSTFCSLVSVPGLGTLQGSPHPWWAREQSRGSPASRTLALKVLLLLLGPKQPLWDQKNLFGHLQYPQRQMSGDDHYGAKLMNIPFLLLIFSQANLAS